MANIRKSDYYYGAFLSVIMNNGITPMLIENNESRRIFFIATDSSDFEVFTKYSSTAHPSHKDAILRWNFTFTKRDKNELKRLAEEGQNPQIVLICSTGIANDAQSEIAVLDISEINQCIDLNRSYKGNSIITIKRIKNKKKLYVYGTARSEFINQKPNHIEVDKNRTDFLGLVPAERS